MLRVRKPSPGALPRSWLNQSRSREAQDSLLSVGGSPALCGDLLAEISLGSDKGNIGNQISQITGKVIREYQRTKVIV